MKKHFSRGTIPARGSVNAYPRAGASGYLIFVTGSMTTTIAAIIGFGYGEENQRHFFYRIPSTNYTSGNTPYISPDINFEVLPTTFGIKISYNGTASNVFYNMISS